MKKQYLVPVVESFTVVPLEQVMLNASGRNANMTVDKSTYGDAEWDYE